MKKIFALVLGIVMPFLFAVTFSSCKKDKVTEDNSEPEGDGLIKNAVKDYDGNTYNAVKLGSQVWMASNLKTTHYADGTEIPAGNMMTDNGSDPHRYCPSDNSSTVGTYGYLYNWAAVMKGANSSTANPSGVQGACPSGWHVPSDAEWTELTDYLKSQTRYQSGGTDNIAKALASTSGCDKSTTANTVGNNQSSNNATGFGAVPAGECQQTPNYFGGCAYFWTATKYGSGTGANDLVAYDRVMRYYEATVTSEEYGAFKRTGMSVRCVRD